MSTLPFGRRATMGQMTEKDLERYVGAVEKVRSARADSVDDAMRRKIAQELGLSAEDLQAAVAAGEADLARAEGLLEHGTWDEALRNLNEADALLPDDVRVAYGIARASAGRFRAGGSDADRARALAEGRRCLDLDPRHEGALALVAELEARPQRRYRRLLLIAAGVAFAVGAGVGVLRLRSWGTRSLCPDGAAFCTIPAQLRAGDLGDGVDLSPAMLQVSPRGLRLLITGRLTHRGSTELNLLRLDVHLLDREGRDVGRLTIDAQPGFAPPLRPGDSRPFLLSKLVPPSTRRALIVAGERREEPGAAAYGPGEVIPVTFASPAPSHLALSAAYRQRNVRTYDGKTVVEGVIEIRNDGHGVIRGLEIQVQGLDDDDQDIGDPSHATIAYTIMPPMLPGEVRTAKTFLRAPGKLAKEKIIVSKLE